MAKNNKGQRVRPLTAAQTAALSGIRSAAFAAGESRANVVRRTFAACGKRPALALYNATKLSLQIGFMASAMARAGDNRADTVLFKHCEERIVHYAGHGGTGKLREGQKGRRNAVEERAYGSARVLTSGIFKEAGVSVAEKRGGDTSKTRTARPTKGKADAKAAKPTFPNPKLKTDVAVNDQLLRYATAMLAFINKNATVASAPAKSLVQDFVAGVKKLPTGK